jgi:hypothetical protein
MGGSDWSISATAVSPLLLLTLPKVEPAREGSVRCPGGSSRAPGSLRPVNFSVVGWMGGEEGQGRNCETNL